MADTSLVSVHLLNRFQTEAWLLNAGSYLAGVGKDGEVVQVANAEDAVFRPAG